VRTASALRSRRGWLVFASLLFALLACAAAWLLWHFWQTAWSQPLATPLKEIHFPPQVFNEDGQLRQSYNKAAVRLSLLALLSVVITVFVRTWVEDLARVLVGLVGGASTLMILLVAWSMQADAQINGRLRTLAETGKFTELESLTRRKIDLPYAPYIGAQALVLAGKGNQLKHEYGAWLQDWGRQAAAKGYIERGTAMRESWEGVSASARVMRSLELVAFGRGTSVFSSDYEARVRRDTLTAERLGLPVGAALALSVLLFAIAASWARVLGRRIRQEEQRLAIVAAESTMPARL